MRGLFFTQYLEMIERMFDLNTVDLILISMRSSDGAYTASAEYPAGDFIELLHCSSRWTGLKIDDLGKLFGIEVMMYLYHRNPNMFEGYSSPFDCLEKLNLLLAESLDHLNPQQSNPEFDVRSENSMVIITAKMNSCPIEVGRGMVSLSVNWVDCPAELP